MTTPRNSRSANSRSGHIRPANRRHQASERRREAILAAALEVFADDGFAAARLDDVAAKAGVAKGTIYLFFEDKEQLFEQILVSAIAPVLTQVEALANTPSMGLDDVLAAVFAYFRKEVLATERREVMRLVLSEGRRFPRIAEAYHREVVSKGLAIVRQIAKTAHRRGELSRDELVRFPHLVFAPLLLAVVWDGLFSKFEMLDVEELLAAHRSVLLGGKARRQSRKA
jgi:AcrR family transcriptional regulator